MASRIDSIVIDCGSTRVLGRFWRDALGYEIAVDQPDDWMVLHDPAGAGVRIGLQQVPEYKIIKNRLHLDITPTVGTFEIEFERLQSLGAQAVRFVENEDGEFHWVLADPEGNEFCLLSPD
jgi:hypothetical protein